MATKFALWFLPFLLFFLMNGHGIGGRDLKEEDLQAYLTGYNTEKKANSQVYLTGYNTKKKNNSQAYLTSYGSNTREKEENSQAYLTGYNTQKEADSQAYLTGYNTKKEADSQTYLTGYNTKKEVNSQAYLTGYNTKNEGDSQAYFTGYNIKKEADSQTYLTGYNTKKEVNSQAYLTGYNNKNEGNSQAYLTGYNTKKEADSQAYLTGYNTKKEEVDSQAYLTGYNTENEGNLQAYLTGYNKRKEENTQQYISGYETTPDTTQSNDKASIKHNHPSHHGKHNDPYIANNKKTTRDSKHKHPSHSHHGNLNQLYITSYQTSNAQDANKPNYLVGYRTSTHDSDKDFAFWSTNKAYDTGYKTTTIYEPYITQYGDLNPKGDSNEPYITQYGDAGSNKHTKDSSPYVANYVTHSKKEKGGPPSSSVDHTEAFKVGFFAMDDLYVGNIMTLQFPVEEFSHFLSKKRADSIPFSTSQLPSVLQLFGVSEDSPQAMSMRGTIDQCEAGTITGETKICATSLESMLEFVNNIIGSEEKHEIHTTSPPSGAPLQKYRIMKVSEDMYAPKWVACHPLPYPYAVYYCHFISTGTRVFKVLLGGENGDKVEALGVCHLDTSDWSPNHILFKQLGFMPGEAPVCHFFPVKHLMWVPKPSTAATM
ncbi:hypothetical protein PIB30_006202 [Stylosanthes scabra]|uniref:BURP domain-containing protein n=1 Tax=Stylosanthes scabra TaxID=79078 RepID=A0ABU6Y4D1_9FABA|nr:hypothetical protein [Stylosanthes scabra]